MQKGAESVAMLLPQCVHELTQGATLRADEAIDRRTATHGRRIVDGRLGMRVLHDRQLQALHPQTGANQVSEVVDKSDFAEKALLFIGIASPSDTLVRS